MSLKKGTMLANYELVMRIGRGGMASVWLAHEHTKASENDRLVAVKTLLPELVGDAESTKMFFDEVRLARSVQHANVVDVYDIGEHDQVLWMAMEWVEGESLHGLFTEASKRHAIPLEIAVRIVADAAAGLHAAHEAQDDQGRLVQLVHRDVSPHNILIGTRGEVKLVDFGVAKALDRISEKTRTGHLKGKFSYMSPEQVRGLSVDRRSDVFSLGIVLYELTTGQRLFRGSSELETLRRVTAARVPRPSLANPGYPPDLEAIVLKALERHVGQRYSSAAAFEGDLRGFLQNHNIVVPRSGIAGLLQRVVGSRIEERRKAARRNLAYLKRSKCDTQDESPRAQQAAGDDWVVQTGSEVSCPNPSSVSSLSQVGSLTRTSRPDAERSWRRPVVALLLAAVAAGGWLLQSRLKTRWLSNIAMHPSAIAPNTTALGAASAGTTSSPSASSQPQRRESPPPSIPVIKIDELESEPGLEPEPAKPLAKPLNAKPRHAHKMPEAASSATLTNPTRSNSEH